MEAKHSNIKDPLEVMLFTQDGSIFVFILMCEPTHRLSYECCILKRNKAPKSSLLINNGNNKVIKHRVFNLVL